MTVTVVAWVLAFAFVYVCVLGGAWVGVNSRGRTTPEEIERNRRLFRKAALLLFVLLLILGALVAIAGV
jgi:hypothetical protein